MKKTLHSSEYEIIKFLALNGPSNRWAIHKGTDINYQTVHSAIKRLLKNFFIDIFDVEKARTDLDKPLYFVTFIGKLAAMAMSENEDSVLDLIATSEPRQFIILKEWEYICRSNLARNYVLSIIRTQFLDLIRSYNREFVNLQSAIGVCTYVLTRSIFWDGYRLGGVERPLEIDGLFQFFINNPQIRERVEQTLIIMEAEAYQLNQEIWEVRRKYGLKPT